jgi:hypothetical protein
MIDDKIDDKIYCVCKLLWSVIRLMIDLLYVEIIMISNKIDDKIDDNIYCMWKLLWSVIRLITRFIVCGNYYDQW